MDSTADGSNVTNGQEEPSAVPSLPPAPKLKSILKKRKAEEPPPEAPAKKPDNVQPPPVIEKPKGGSITAALKMLTDITPASDDEDEADPKPSAFILEMEKQKDKLPVMVPGALSFPNRLEGIEVADMDWQNSPSPPQPEPNNFFQQEQKRLKELKEKKETKNTSQVISKPPKRKKIKILKGPLTMLTPHEQEIEGIVLINNLPFKVQAEELVKILGIWPKGGYDGIKMIVDGCALPAGYAYIVVERHSDMMDILRLSGLEMQGRKIKCTLSNPQNLIADWKSTRKALAILDKSTVIKVAQLPYSLRKSELIKALDKVEFTKEDIYWSALRDGQSNSGRGFIVLKSRDDARVLSAIKYFTAGNRTIEITRVHPADLEKFCAQCKLEINKKHILHEPITEDFDDVSELNLCGKEPKAEPNTTTDESSLPPSNYVVVSDDDEPVLSKPEIPKKKIEIKSRRLVPERDFPPRGAMPPFQPTPFVRMYNVPEKSRHDDIRNFFKPILPAKIVHSHGYAVYDLEFYNPDEAMNVMRKHLLLMRKNVIALEMLPGPPTTLVPESRRMPPPAAMMAPQMELGPPGVDPGPFPPGMGPPGQMPPGMPHPRMGMPPVGPGPGGIMPGLHGPFPIHGGPMPGPMPRPGGPIPGPGGPLPFPGGPPPGPHGPMPFPGGHPPGPGGPMPFPGGRPPGPGGPMFGPGPPMFGPDTMMMHPGRPMAMGPGPMLHEPHGQPPVPGSIDPRMMPRPMHDNASLKGSRKLSRRERSPSPERPIKPKKELIPVPPLPEDFATYTVPSFKKDTPVGQGVITTMQGYFCQLCNKFYSSKVSAKDAHCKTKGHYDRLKQFLQEKKRLRKLAENEAKKK